MLGYFFNRRLNFFFFYIYLNISIYLKKYIMFKYFLTFNILILIIIKEDLEKYYY